jgi:hypothetical protein
MKRQRLKLMDMIAALVGSLDQRELFGRCTGKELPREFNRPDSSNERHGGIAVRASCHPPRAEGGPSSLGAYRFTVLRKHYFSARVLLTLTTVEPKCGPKGALLANTFGLTPAEARVASMIAEGLNPERAAQQTSFQSAAVEVRIGIKPSRFGILMLGRAGIYVPLGRLVISCRDA